MENFRTTASLYSSAFLIYFFFQSFVYSFEFVQELLYFKGGGKIYMSFRLNYVILKRKFEMPREVLDELLHLKKKDNRKDGMGFYMNHFISKKKV